MTGRSIEELGFADIPVKEPLTYPGRIINEPLLLSRRELLPLGVRPDRLGAWGVAGADVDQAAAPSLDEALAGLGQDVTGKRFPVIAVGSNACPGQVSYKFDRVGIADALPMVPVRVRGIKVGLSAHISPAGYVAAAPHMAPEADTTLVVTWLDTAQLKIVDDTEFPNYRRAMLPGDVFPMTMPSGERLGGAYIYYSSHGVLAGGDGEILSGGGDQATLLAALLAKSAQLRGLLGPVPESWVELAGTDEECRQAGTRAFRDEGWLTAQPEFAQYEVGDSDLRVYNELASAGRALC
ncbi:hypothetical protein [Streptomyces sp. NPDC005525]|uniref:hypothetical protein n=1 Tax=Streptomyces sp. NPDC005525 TaxID=3364720 RepID=UPI0036A5E732